MGDELIRIDNLSKKYREQYAISNCNLTIKRGAIYGIVGPNGAGKTTLFKLLLSLIRPSEGEIIFCSDDNNCDDIKFGALIERPYINPNMTAFQNLRYIELLNKINDNDRINEVIEMVGLSSAGNKKAKKYSLGMQQRLGIAMSIVNRPDILILDEPMNGLDPEGIIDVRRFLLEYNHNEKNTILISSHILAELDKLVTDYIFIKEGRILLSASRNMIEKDMENIGETNFEEYYLRVIKNG